MQELCSTDTSHTEDLAILKCQEISGTGLKISGEEISSRGASPVLNRNIQSQLGDGNSG